MDRLKRAAEWAAEPRNARANSMGMDALEALSSGSVVGSSDKHLRRAINQAALAASIAAYGDNTDLTIDVEPADE